MTSLAYRFGSVVRAARTRHGWSQEQLADLADLNRTYLGEVERGAATPSIATAHKLAHALGIGLPELLARAEAWAQPHDAAIRVQALSR